MLTQSSLATERLIVVLRKFPGPCAERATPVVGGPAGKAQPYLGRGRYSHSDAGGAPSTTSTGATQTGSSAMGPSICLIFLLRGIACYKIFEISFNYYLPRMLKWEEAGVLVRTWISR